MANKNSLLSQIFELTEQKQANSKKVKGKKTTKLEQEKEITGNLSLNNNEQLVEVLVNKLIESKTPKKKTRKAHEYTEEAYKQRCELLAKNREKALQTRREKAALKKGHLLDIDNKQPKIENSTIEESKKEEPKKDISKEPQKHNDNNSNDICDTSAPQVLGKASPYNDYINKLEARLNLLEKAQLQPKQQETSKQEQPKQQETSKQEQPKEQYKQPVVDLPFKFGSFERVKPLRINRW